VPLRYNTLGSGFPGQLGAHDDRHIAGLTRLADGIKAHHSHAVVQLQHSGMRAQPDYCSGVPQCPSDDEETGSKAMSDDQVKALIDDLLLRQSAARKPVLTAWSCTERMVICSLSS
jgi:2,4-dienoyl-CoA reductase-like NADH-dependent reductase (Old Yellow Enzyme family)